MVDIAKLETRVKDYFRHALQQGATQEDATVLLLSILAHIDEQALDEGIWTATRYYALNPVKEGN
jgi:hypothetical protein